MRRQLLALVTASTLVAGIAACSPTTDQPEVTEPPSSAATDPVDLETIELPSTDLGATSQWLLEIINGDHELTAAEAQERFAPSFLEAVGSPDEVVAAFSQAVTLGPFRPVGYDEATASATTHLQADSGSYLMSIALDGDLITGAAVQLAPEVPEPAESWDALTDRIEVFAVPTSVTVFDVSAGTIEEPVYAAGDLTGPQPSGSMFKLYVLLAVVAAVEAGDLTWDSPLTIDDAVRSLPSGVLQEEPDGTEVSVQEAATGMISISDNTATDLLIRAVGRDAVEAAIAEYAPDGADASTPLLTTRDFFEIGWGEGGLAQQWSAADDAGRAALIDQVASAPLTTVATDVTVPVWDRGVDWFFSAADLARAQLALAQAADTDAGARVAEILTANPGLNFGDHWDSVAFKGGSSIGVLGGSWYLTSADASFVIVVQSATADEAQAQEQASAIYLAGDAAALLAQE